MLGNREHGTTLNASSTGALEIGLCSIVQGQLGDDCEASAGLSHDGDLVRIATESDRTG